MQTTINLFNLIERNTLPEHVVSSIAPKPDNLDKDVEKILKAICSAFKRALQPAADFKVRCNFESNYSPDEKSLRYGGSIVIPDSRNITGSELQEYRRICEDQALHLELLSGYLAELRNKDGDLPGSICSASWFESELDDNREFAKKMDIELIKAIRRTPILEDIEIELELFDKSQIVVEIPSNTTQPTKHREEKSSTIDIRSATRQANNCEAFVDGEKTLMEVEFPAEYAKTIVQAFLDIRWLEATVISVYSLLDGIKKISRFEIVEIIGPAKNQSKNLF